MIKMKTIGMFTAALMVFACSSGTVDSDTSPPRDPGPADQVPVDPSNPTNPTNPTDPGPTAPVNPVEGASAAQLLTGPANEFSFFDGPVFRDGILYVSNYYENMIVARSFLADGQDFQVFRNTTFQPIGSKFDGAAGEFVTVEVQGAGWQLVRSTANGAAPMAIAFAGQAWRSPNDLAFRSDGLFYVTDPGYQSGSQQNGIYFVVNGTATQAVPFNLGEQPNGLALSLDQKFLYVSLTALGVIMKYDVALDGNLSNPTTFATLTGLVPDGLAIDSAGNLYVAIDTGINVYAPDGTLWGHLATDKPATGMVLGGTDRKTLFVTAFGGIYRIDGMKVPGNL